MESSRSLHVKAFLLKEGREEGMKEIRRFQMKEWGGSDGFQSLLTGVCSVFNMDPINQPCSLYWKDDDGDLILFSRDEEVRDALDSVRDGTLRIYVILKSGRPNEGPSAPLPERDSEASKHAEAFSFPAPSVFPPPRQGHPHPLGSPHPLPVFSPYTHCRYKPTGLGRLKGGWRGGLYYGCPWNMQRELYGREFHESRGKFKHKKMKKMRKRMAVWHMLAAEKERSDFCDMKEQVPTEFRQWVLRYLQTWKGQGAEAALQTAGTAGLPQCVAPHFPHWLHAFLARHYPHPSTQGQTAMDTRMEEGEAEKIPEGETEKAPDCIPAVYYQWLRLFVPRFFQGKSHSSFSACADLEEEGGLLWPGAQGHMCKERHKVSKGFRKFVLMTFKQLRKGKQGDKNRKMREKATRAGVSTEVQEFVEQVMLEWSAKLSGWPEPHTLATHMTQEERSLPAGLQRQHFLWLVRFLARCHKGPECGALPGWHGDPQGSDSSREEEEEEELGHRPCPPFPPPPPMMGSSFCPPFMGSHFMGGAPFMGMPPPPPFSMHVGMGHPFPPPPPPPPYGFAPFSSHGCPFPYPDQTTPEDSTESSSSAEDEVKHVTERLKKM